MKQLLTIRVFRRLLGGWTLSNLADSALFLSLAVWAKDLSGSSSAAGLVFFALALPSLGAPVLGLLVDRMRRKTVLVTAHLCAGVAAGSLVLAREESDLWLLYLVTVLYGTLGVLNGSAQSGLLRDLLPDHALADANGLLSTIDQGLRVVTPALGAGLYVLWGGPALGLGIGLILVVSGLILATVRVTETPPERASEPFWSETLAGFRHLAAVPVLARIVLVTAVAFGVVGLFDTVLFELVEHGLDREPAFFGVLMSLQGAGSIAGGLTAARMLRWLGPARTVGVALGTIGSAAGSMVLDVLPLGIPLLPVTIVAITAAGAAIPWMVVALITTRQRLTPPGLQGRASAATNLAMTLPQLGSIAAGAALVAVLDYRLLLLVAAAVLLGCAGVLLSGRTPAGGTDGSDPAAAVEPDVAGPDVTGPDAAAPEIAPGPDAAGPDAAGAQQDGPDRAGPDRAGSDRAGPDRAGSDRTGPDRAGPVTRAAG